MDCEMPEMDGFEATRLVREQEARIGRREADAPPASTFARSHAPHARIPLIAMTAKALAGDREKCLAAGMDDYLSKPVLLEALVKLLERWLPRQDATASDRELASATTTTPEVTAASGESPALDPQTLRRWQQLAARTHSPIFAEILSTFRQDALLTVQALRREAEAGQADELRRLGHKLRGASLNLGANRLAELAAQLEELGPVFRADEAMEVITQLEFELARVNAAISTHL